jgi:hypothetical protein
MSRYSAVTRRILALTLTLAFAAPWAALCLADAPDHTMACCQRGQTVPLVRPCCSMGADPAGVTVPATAQAIAPMEPVGVFIPPAETRRFHRDALTASVTRPIEIRLLTSLFLI